MDLSLSEHIAGLKPHQFGRFGEFVFASLCAKRGSVILAQHDGRVDFVVDGVAVDVKTSIKHIRTSRRNASPKYSGQRVAGVIYCTVTFMSDAVSVSLPTGSEVILPWAEVQKFWDMYSVQNLRLTKTEHRTSKKELIEPIRQRVANACSLAGRSYRFLYRTCQANFGGESPHNLKPDSIEVGRITVFVEFADHRIAPSNIRRIIAFGDEAAAMLPMRTKRNLGRPKVDLGQISERYVFRSLDDFEHELASRTGLWAK